MPSASGTPSRAAAASASAPVRRLAASAASPAGEAAGACSAFEGTMSVTVMPGGNAPSVWLNVVVCLPTRIDGVPYTAVGYSMAKMNAGGGMEGVYRTMPEVFAPQLKLVFAQLLRGEQPTHAVPVVERLAGQERLHGREPRAVPEEEADRHRPFPGLRPATLAALLLPILVAGGSSVGMKGGRHIKYSKPTPLANLHLTLLDKAGVHLDSFADSKGKVDELFEPMGI